MIFSPRRRAGSAAGWFGGGLVRREVGSVRAARFRAVRFRAVRAARSDSGRAV
ncbi:hypothetical protein [Saccharothrix sp.]|uniref:hypothetical protein n=1 Tax=Saccharothrix sp. TaxID=1873460 RepID=UPI0028112256|nr:hypothetical protein [Saccharothrix sp.]